MTKKEKRSLLPKDYIQLPTSSGEPPTPPTMRKQTNAQFCLIQDNDSHWYVIKADQRETFRQWVEWTENYEEGDYTGPDFNSNRVNGPHTVVFGEWKEI